MATDTAGRTSWIAWVLALVVLIAVFSILGAIVKFVFALIVPLLVIALAAYLYVKFGRK